MGFTRMKFTPEKGLRNSTVYPAKPQTEEEAREQVQGLLDQLMKAVNGLMGALENADTEVSGAAKIGSEPVTNLEYGGAAPTTIRGQIIALNEKIINAITNGLSVSQILGNGDIKAGMVDAKAVTIGCIDDNAVTENCIADRAVSATKLGTIGTITLDEAGMIFYDTTNNKLKLKVAGCREVQLCPVVYGPEATPPTDQYPAGTVYIQYV